MSCEISGASEREPLEDLRKQWTSPETAGILSASHNISSVFHLSVPGAIQQINLDTAICKLQEIRRKHAEHREKGQSMNLRTPEQAETC